MGREREREREGGKERERKREREIKRGRERERGSEREKIWARERESSENESKTFICLCCFNAVSLLRMKQEGWQSHAELRTFIRFTGPIDMSLSSAAPCILASSPKAKS